MKKIPWSLLVYAFLLVFLFRSTMSEKIDAEALTLTEQSIRRAAVQCYALEGSYPTDLSYLEQRYGVSVDSKHYFVDYIYIASNLMPDITVLPVS